MGGSCFRIINLKIANVIISIISKGAARFSRPYFGSKQLLFCRFKDGKRQEKVYSKLEDSMHLCVKKQYIYDQDGSFGWIVHFLSLKYTKL